MNYKIIIINGPNLNLLGEREQSQYGSTTLDQLKENCFKKAQEMGEDLDEKDFRYPGPRPFSKETAILMMADAVEAASKSLREPTVDKIQQFVDTVVNKQVDEKQFNDCNITLSEIETVKKVLSKKLINIYHLRVEYPE